MVTVDLWEVLPPEFCDTGVLLAIEGSEDGYRLAITAFYLVKGGLKSWGRGRGEVMERSYGEEEGGRERARDEEKGRRREGKRYGYTAMAMMVLPCSSSSNMAAVPVGTRPGLCKPLGTGALGPIPACGDYREGSRGGEEGGRDSIPSFLFTAFLSFFCQ